MRYKTIVLELLEQDPRILEELRRRRTLLPTLERCSTALKESHEAWKAQLLQIRPESDPSQIASEAQEIALERFRSDSLSALIGLPDDGTSPNGNA